MDDATPTAALAGAEAALEWRLDAQARARKDVLATTADEAAAAVLLQAVRQGESWDCLAREVADTPGHAVRLRAERG